MYVFISHDVRDKADARLRAVVNRLLDVLHGDERIREEERIRLWIDDPIEIGTYPRILECARIPLGSSWDEAIEKALDHDKICILFFLSHHSREKLRDNGVPKVGSLEWEVQRGQASDRLVAVRLDATKPQDLAPRYQRIQCLDLSSYAEADEKSQLKFQALIDELKKKLNPQSAGVDRLAAFKLRGMQTASIQPPDPFAADRTAQSRRFHATIADIQAARSAVKSLIFAGPDDEEPVQFLERCFRESRRALGEEPCDRKSVCWPEPDVDFATSFREALSSHFFGEPTAPRERIIQSLKDIRHLTVFYSILAARDWTRHEPERIRTWLREWRSFSDEAGGGLRAVPLLCVTFGDCRDRLWRELPPTTGIQQVENKDIWRAIVEIGAEQGEANAVALKPQLLLAPLRRADADHWLATLRDQARSGSRHYADELTPVVNELFRTASLRWLFFAPKEEPRVTMRQFARRLNKLINSERPAAAP